MYIKSVIIDGFKSYGQRTEINGFDPVFNAITGLNGSGKSNILDAICFVLGITNLQQVRAGSMQELVYKNGQAGVNKASVSIKFNNSDPTSRPVGYESHEEIIVTRQVVIGGKNKYLLNGTNVQNKRIQDLFCSVQMNVNNPHFLIMQGRITKVLNMKPPEILMMIEEAAGTRMYEAKRQSSQKLIEKKDAKLAQLNEVIDEEIKPKLNKLREEKGQYVEYQKVLRELDSQTRIYHAYRYVTLVETSTMTNSTINRMQTEIAEWKEQITSGEQELKDLDERVEELHRKRDEETGGKLEELEKELKANEKLEAQASSLLKGIKENIISEQKKKKQLEKNLKEDELALASKEAELKKMQGIFDQLKAADATDAEALAAAQRKFQAVSSGLLADDDGTQATLQEQLMKARQQSAQAQDELKQAQMQLQHSQNELKSKEKEMKATTTDYQSSKKAVENLEREVKNIQNQLDKGQYKEGSLETLEQEKRQLSDSVRNIRDSIERIEARNPQLTFRYKDPSPDFDRSSVKGLVCQQFKVKDPSYYAALQQAAGGKMYFVIVDTEKTGKDIVLKGQLTSRANMIPLNKITARTIDQHTVKVATDLVGKENVFPALSLIEYRPEVHKAMQFVFGDLFVCRDMKAAMKVAFDKRVFKKCVTLSGDMADPSGTMSGGAAAKGQPVLSIVSELIELQNVLTSKTTALGNVEKKLKSIVTEANKYTSLKESLDLRQHELDISRQRLQQSEQHQHQEEVDALKTQIKELGEKLVECKKLSSEGDKRAKELEKKMLNAKEVQQRELKAAEQEMARLKKQAAASREQWTQRQQESESLDLEIKDLKVSIETGQAQIIETQTALDDLTSKSSEGQQAVVEANAVVRTTQGTVKAMKDMINQKNKDIHSILSRKEKIIKEKGDIELEIKKSEHEISKVQAEHKDAIQNINALIEKYAWISTDKQYFGKQGIYNFKDYDMTHLGKSLGDLRELKDKLGRTVNTRAMNMLEQQEDECGDLISKKNIVEKDKAKIMEVIRELDEKKKIALRRACDQVNKDFGSIFSSLLPGAQARLQPPDGKDVLDGLEVKVGFSNVWKDSLGELSGGQRSLVALSLILAMLLFKPAPIYILDEVDAALDLSHTQNIGTMLKKHFRHSQFIIVSLKDGMFCNANVLFRTEFKDGMSTVSRTVQTS